MKNLLPTLALATTLPLAAQTTVHHTTTTAHSTTAHRTTATTAAKCSVTLPPISAKIPALPATAPKCPAILYQLSYIDLKIGEGELATSKKFYTVHYTGYLPDGTKFDSSVDRGEPITFPYGAHRVITGWDTGFEGMHIGGKRRLFVPYQLAYGEDGHPPVIPAKSMLIFDVELIAQSATPPAPPEPPASAQPAGSTAPATAPKPTAAPTTNPTTTPSGAQTTVPAPSSTTPPSNTPKQ